MRRSLAVYFSTLVTWLLLFVASRLLGSSFGDDWSWQIHKTVVSFLTAAAAVGTWGAAVSIASVHRVVWPLVVAVILVVATMVFLVGGAALDARLR